MPGLELGLVSVFLGDGVPRVGLALVSVCVETEYRDRGLALVSVCLGDRVLRRRDGNGVCLAWRLSAVMAGLHW